MYMYIVCILSFQKDALPITHAKNMHTLISGFHCCALVVVSLQIFPRVTSWHWIYHEELGHNLFKFSPFLRQTIIPTNNDSISFEPLEKTLKSKSKYENFHSRKYVWKCRRRNSYNALAGSTVWNIRYCHFRWKIITNVRKPHLFETFRYTSSLCQRVNQTLPGANII